MESGSSVGVTVITVHKHAECNVKLGAATTVFSHVHDVIAVNFPF